MLNVVDVKNPEPVTVILLVAVEPEVSLLVEVSRSVIFEVSVLKNVSNNVSYFVV